MKIVMIGSGNVATHLSMALQYSGHEITQVFSKSIANAKTLANKLSETSNSICLATDTISSISCDADAYIFSIKDDALLKTAMNVGSLHRQNRKSSLDNNNQPLFIHTAGSVPMDIFQGITDHYGVIYPMQTFSKERTIDFWQVPCFIEFSDDYSHGKILTLTRSITNKIQEISSEKRRMMHLAAVFACNLTNHCYRLAEKIVEKEDIDFKLFLPLIEETAKKVSELSPKNAQTGPMVRNDVSVMNKQLELIDDERIKQIYKLMAESIFEDRNNS